MRERAEDRGVTPVIGTILVVAIVVILAAVVGTAALAYTDLLKDPAPNVGTVEAELVPNVVGDPDDQTVEFTNVASDPIETKDLEVVVDATDACGKRTRLLDPLASNIVDKTDSGTTDFEGDDILDEFGLKGVFGTGSNEQWKPGSKASLRIANGKCDIASGEQVTVRIVHTPSQTTIVDSTLTAR